MHKGLMLPNLNESTDVWSYLDLLGLLRPICLDIKFKYGGLTFTTLRANSVVYFIYFFPQKTGFDISWELNSLETICMKCQTCSLENHEMLNIFFSAERKKNQNVVCNYIKVEFTGKCYCVLYLTTGTRALTAGNGIKDIKI